MVETLNAIPIECDLRPAYYDDFQCLSENCRLTCCKGWHITFDKKDYKSLKKCTGSPEFSACMAHALRRLRGAIASETMYGEIRLNEDGVCPLQLESGLCSLQLEKGHTALPYVCRIFPRKERVVLSGYLEHSLSPACEGVLELLWNLPEGVDFRSDPLPVKHNLNLSAEDRAFLNLHFQEIRSLCIDLLQDRRIALPQRILLMGMALKSLADGEADLTRWMARTQLLADQAAAGKLTLCIENEQSLHKFLANNIRFLSQLPVGNDDFKTVSQELLDAVTVSSPSENGNDKIAISARSYLEARVRFQEQFASHDYFMENLMVSLFFHLQFPKLNSADELWKSYISFCNLYSIYRFLAVMTCRKGAAGDKDELFRLMVYASRKVIHNQGTQTDIQDVMLRTESATLAHMAILLGS